ncbi:MAG: TM1812 family CRISPR-associated protein, partial [Selenomonadaceae bacterium]|nr:TM1812 family CRISPR-associated protein [Selenomonadaceae bacterium]
MKNVIVLGLDLVYGNYEIRDEKGEYCGHFGTQSEGLIKYLIYVLEREQKTLDYILALTMGEAHNYDWFRGVFPQIPMEFVRVEGASIKDNLPLATDIFGKIIEYKNSVAEEVELNFELPGDFRYNSVVLSLVELAKYDDLNIRRVFYMNTSVYPRIIEEISPFFNIPTLAKGAEDFIHNGQTHRLREFFSKNEAREHVTNLLDKMTAFSETLRICGSYNVTEKALKDLSAAVKNYELYLNLRLKKLLDKTTELSESLKNCADGETAEAVLRELTGAVAEYRDSANVKEPVDFNELYFTRLLPKIKAEYQDVLTEITPMGIIRWCLKRGFLQQAVTFYAEWLPRYLEEAGYIQVLDRILIRECKENSILYSHWTHFLFRTYLPKESIKGGVNQADLNLHKDLLPVFVNGEAEKVIEALDGRNEKLENFVLYIRNFSEEHPVETVANVITELPPNDLIRKLMEAITPNGAKFDKFVTSRINNERNTERVLIKALATLPKNKIKYFYDYDENDFLGDNVVRKSRSRREVFEILLKNKTIITTLNEEKLLNFVESYGLIVRGLRNK